MGVGAGRVVELGSEREPRVAFAHDTLREELPGRPLAPIRWLTIAYIDIFRGIPFILILLLVVLLVFGPKRLPEMGRSLGKGMREFKDSVTGKDKDELPEGSAEKPEPTTVTPAAVKNR